MTRFEAQRSRSRVDRALAQAPTSHICEGAAGALQVARERLGGRQRTTTDLSDATAAKAPPTQDAAAAIELIERRAPAPGILLAGPSTPRDVLRVAAAAGPEVLIVTGDGAVPSELADDPRAIDVPTATRRFCAPYSPSEEALSAITAAAARAAVAAAAPPLPEGLGFPDAKDFEAACTLPFDDRIFDATKLSWCVCEAAVALGAQWIIADGPAATMRGLAALAAECAPEAEFLPLCGSPLATADPADAVPWPEAKKRRRRPFLRPRRGATFLIGRPFDRNYGPEIESLRQELGDRRIQIFDASIRLGFRHAKRVIFRRRYFLNNMVYAYLLLGDLRRIVAGRLNPGTRQRREAAQWARALATADPKARAALLAAEPHIRSGMSTLPPRMRDIAISFRDMFADDREVRILCLPGRDWVARIACIVARANDVPSFDVQTVFVGPRARYKPTEADFQVAMDTASAEIFQTYFGLADASVLLGGGISLAKTVGAIERACERRPASSERSRILFAASPSPADCLPMLTTLCDYVEPTPDVELVVRLHPAATDDATEAFLAALGQSERRRLSNRAETPLADDVAAADLVATRFSNVGLAAGLAGKPVVVYREPEAPLPISLGDMGVALEADSLDALARLLAGWQAGAPDFEALRATQAQFLEANRHLAASNPTATLLERIALAANLLSKRGN